MARQLIGQKFGKLTVVGIEQIQKTNSTRSYARCKCDCGKERIIRTDYLQNSKFIHACKDCSKKSSLKNIEKEIQNNSYIVKGVVTEILIDNKNLVCLIDTEDLSKTQIGKWYVNSKGYIVNKKDRNIRLHRLVLGITNDLLIDHINGNKLDNRKANLRICDKFQNQHNRNKSRNNTSGYKGVYYDKERNCWGASIMCHNKKYHLGRFSSKELAATAYNEAALKLHGDFAKINQLPEEDRENVDH